MKCKCTVNVAKFQATFKGRPLEFLKDKRSKSANATNRVGCGILLEEPRAERRRRLHPVQTAQSGLVYPDCAPIANQQIDKGLAVSLANSLAMLDLVDTLDLRKNLLDHTGLAAIATVLGKKPSLRSLHLDWNRIGPQGGKAIRQLLEESKSLWHLTLGISDDQFDRHLPARLRRGA